nr:MAG TPA: hypothetical protein [Caudoviricetes sp.]
MFFKIPIKINYFIVTQFNGHSKSSFVIFQPGGADKEIVSRRREQNNVSMRKEGERGDIC